MISDNSRRPFSDQKRFLLSTKNAIFRMMWVRDYTERQKGAFFPPFFLKYCIHIYYIHVGKFRTQWKVYKPATVAAN